MPLDKDVLILYWTNNKCNASWEVLQQALNDFTSVYELELWGRKAIQVSAEPAPPQLLMRIYPMKGAEIAGLRLRENLPTWRERYLERKIFFSNANEAGIFFNSEDIIYLVELGKYRSTEQ